MSGFNMPKIQDAINLRTSDTSNITHFQIQSALDLRLDSFDGNPRTVTDLSVSGLPSPVRDSFFSDPGNLLLAERLKDNSSHLTRLLASRVKSAPFTIAMRMKVHVNERHSRSVATKNTKHIPVPPSSTAKPEPRRRQLYTAPEQRQMCAVPEQRQTPTLPAPVKSRPARSAPPNRSRTIKSKLQSTSVNRRYQGNRPKSSTCAPTLNSKRAEQLAWCQNKGSQSLSFSNICRPLPISYNSFLAETTSCSFSTKVK